MNGDKLLEAMSFVDEKYIAEAETKVIRRKNYWAPLAAAAACFCLILYGWNAVKPPVTEEMPKAAMSNAAPEMNRSLMMDESNTIISIVPTLASDMELEVACAKLPQFTVRVTAVQDSTFTAMILEGTEEIERTFTLPENTPLPEVGSGLIVTYLPETMEEEIITVTEITPAE